jgi:3-oxoacyl-[acyl-carrier protein] reductase
MKNFVIVGASSGIGQAIAQGLLAKGHQVFSFSRNTPNLNGVAHQTFDAQSPDLTVFDNLPAEIHGIVYAPGTINLKPFQRLSPADFQQDLQINVLSAVGVLQKIQPRLKAANGASVVLFSTVAVQTGLSFHASVATAKGAIEGLSRALAAEWAPAKIRVNTLAPSLTDTPLAQALLGNDEKKDASNKRHPIGRYGQPEDVAHMALLLLDEAGSWITGQVIGIDGGMGRLR